ncbi:hypothetical protein [Evansella cellulosilytica]|nr:hypothetical protein [Evansella cellulosilytica]
MTHITKDDVLRLIDNLSDDDLRIVYTFIEEYRAAEAEEKQSSFNLEK